MADDPYQDILYLPHHRSATRPHMDARERAAQFSPFAALTGHGDAIREAGRITEDRPGRGDGETEELNRRLLLLSGAPGQTVTVTYFRPDPRKDGGETVALTSAVRKADAERQLLVLAGGTEIPFQDLISLSPPDAEGNG